MTAIQDVIEGRSEGCVMQGDCIEVMAELADATFDLIVTDPAYPSLDVEVSTGTTTRLVGLDQFAGKRLASSNGKRWFSTVSLDDMPELYGAMRRLLKNSGALYVFGDVKSGLEMFPPLRPANVIVWDKGQIGMGYNWRRTHEWIAYCPMPEHHLRDKGAGDVIRVPGVTTKIHPTEKPVALLERLIANSSDVGDVVFDPMCGSGSTLAAARRSGRRYIGIELDEVFAESARRRLASTERPLFGGVQ